MYQTGQSRVVQGFLDAGREPGHRDSSTWGQSPSVVTTGLILPQRSQQQKHKRAKRLHYDSSTWGQSRSVVTTRDSVLILQQGSPEKGQKIKRHSQQYMKLPQRSPQKKTKRLPLHSPPPFDH